MLNYQRVIIAQSHASWLESILRPADFFWFEQEKLTPRSVCPWSWGFVSRHVMTAEDALPARWSLLIRAPGTQVNIKSWSTLIHPKYGITGSEPSAHDHFPGHSVHTNQQKSSWWFYVILTSQLNPIKMDRKTDRNHHVPHTHRIHVWYIW